MVSRGVDVTPEVLQAFEEIKMKSQHRFVIFKISNDKSKIIVERKVQQASYDEFLESLPADDCLYAMYDFEYKMNDGSARSKLVFITWSPDVANCRKKMLYATEKDVFMKELVGYADEVLDEVLATNLDEIEYDVIFNKVSAGGTK